MIADSIINKILEPISDDLPSGTNVRNNLKYRDSYFDLKDIRCQARQHERRFSLDEESLFETPSWDSVYNISLNLLTNATKDVEVVVWLIESMVRKFQFRGFSQGIELLTNLITKYWSSIHPRSDELDYHSIFFAIENLNGVDHNSTLIEPLSNIKVTQYDSNVDISMWQYKKIIHDSDHDKLAFVENIIKKTPADFYKKMLIDITQCNNNYLYLIEKIKELSNNQITIPSSNIKNALNDFSHHIEILISNNSLEQKNTSQSCVLAAEEPSQRDLALKKIDEVINYFKKNEPQSPVPCLLTRAKDWADLPLRDLIKEIINDDSQIKRAFEITGIKQ